MTAERALHPVSDATPDLALYDLPALASEPVPATGNPEEIDVEAYHRRMEHILDDMDANPGASGYTDLIRAAWRESWVARQREGER